MEKELTFRGYCYFIERTDTNEWVYIHHGFQEGIDTAHPGEMTYENRWTKDPLKAERFSTKEIAEAVLFLNYELNQIGCVVTEHEFIDSSVEAEMQRREREFAVEMLNSVTEHFESAHDVKLVISLIKHLEQESLKTKQQ